MMSKKKFSLVLVFFIYVIFISDIIANYFYLYWRFWWFDIIMHFLGGLWIAGLMYYLFFLSDYLPKVFKKYSVFILTFSFVLIIGILWEIFEYITKVSVRQDNYVLDTYLDLLMDMFGWVLAYFLLSKLKLGKFFIAKKEETDKIIDTVKSS